MIQRIQSIFLLLASLSLGGTFALPFADSSEEVAVTVFADSVFSVFDSLALMVAFGSAAVVALLAIFLFNNRPLQKKMATLSGIITLGAVGIAIYTYMAQAEQLVGVTIDDEPGIFLPAVGFVLAMLAVRYINKDERLVRSADRLR